MGDRQEKTRTRSHPKTKYLTLSRRVNARFIREPRSPSRVNIALHRLHEEEDRGRYLKRR